MSYKLFFGLFNVIYAEKLYFEIYLPVYPCKYFFPLAILYIIKALMYHHLYRAWLLNNPHY